MTNWLTDLMGMFLPKKERIKISPDHLPGLRPPRIMPSIPPRGQEEATPGPDIEAMYRAYRASGPRPKRRQKRTKGLGL
jgi:hypothetical protein